MTEVHGKVQILKGRSFLCAPLVPHLPRKNRSGCGELIKEGLSVHKGPWQVWELQMKLEMKGETERTVCSHMPTVPAYFSLRKVSSLYFSQSLFLMGHLLPFWLCRWKGMGPFDPSVAKSITVFMLRAVSIPHPFKTLKAIPFFCASGRLCTLPPKSQQLQVLLVFTSSITLVLFTSITLVKQYEPLCLGHYRGNATEGNFVCRYGMLSMQVWDSFQSCTYTVL